MNNFDAYQPSKWVNDGLILSTSSLAHTPKADPRSANWRWFSGVASALTVAGAIVAGSTFFAAGEAGAAVGYSIPQIASHAPVARGFDTSSSRVPDGYWDALQHVLREAPKLPESKYFDSPEVAI